MLGLYFGNDPLNTLLNSLLVMFAALVVGLFFGSIAQKCIDEQISQHKRNNPIPDDDLVDSEPQDPDPQTV